SSRRRHTRFSRDWSSDVCSSDLNGLIGYASGDHGYVLNPAVDLGKGRVLYRQPQRVPHGPPLPIPVGTPWQIQQLLGDGPGALRSEERRVGKEGEATARRGTRRD